MRVLFVGPISGFTSYPVVSKGLIQALTSAGFEVDVADTSWDGSTDHTAPDLMDEKRAIRFLDRKEVVKLVQQGESTGGEGDVCVAINPSHHMMGIREKGYKIAGMFVGDVDTIPGSWKALMEQQDVILTPSSWGKYVIEKAGIEQQVIVCNHGVSPLFYPDECHLDDYPFVFLHTCSAIYYPERKGTPQVLEAFSKLVETRKNVSLRLVLGGKTKPMRRMLNALDKSVLERMQIHFREGAREPAEIRRAYQSCHAGLFPSRAEGFGMMALEVRACGVPVVQTLCTGHEDHLDEQFDPRDWGMTVVRHGQLAPAWGKFGKAPEVTADGVLEGMSYCLDHRDELRVNALEKADAVREGWSWEQTTKPLIDWIRSVS